MNSSFNPPFVIAFVVVVVLLLLFGGVAMAGALMNDGVLGSSLLGARSWMWTPALLILGFGAVLGQFIFKKKG